MVPSNTTSTLATMNSFNDTDKSSYSVPQLRAFHDFSKISHINTENKKSEWPKKQNIKSLCPVVVTDDSLLQNEALLQNFPLGGVLHGVFLDNSIPKTNFSHSCGSFNSAQYSTGTNTVSSPDHDSVIPSSQQINLLNNVQKFPVRYGTVQKPQYNTDSVRTGYVQDGTTLFDPDSISKMVPFTFNQGLTTLKKQNVPHLAILRENLRNMQFSVR